MKRIGHVVGRTCTMYVLYVLKRHFSLNNTTLPYNYVLVVAFIVASISINGDKSSYVIRNCFHSTSKSTNY